MVLILSSSQTIGTTEELGDRSGDARLGVVPSCVFVLAALKSYVRSKRSSVDGGVFPIYKGKALVHGRMDSPAQHYALRVRRAATDVEEQQTQCTREGPSMQGTFRDPEILTRWRAGRLAVNRRGRELQYLYATPRRTSRRGGGFAL